MTNEIKKYNFKDSLQTQIEIIDLSLLTTTHSETITLPHRTNFYHIFWFQECSPTHIIDFEPVKIVPNTWLFINKDKVHMFSKKEKYEGQVLIFTDTFYCAHEEDTMFLRSTILFNDMLNVANIRISKSPAELTTLFKLLETEQKRPTENHQRDLLKNYLHSFLLLADREKTKLGYSEIKKGADLDYTLLFKDLLDVQFTRLKSVNGYATQLSISEKRLNQATTKVLGKSPKELIDDRILLEAKRLLIHVNKSIKEIGFQLGFEEPTNFIKYFRKHVAKTPVEFRESYFC